MSRWSIIASAACLALLAGCGVWADANEPTPPPDAIAIRVYTNGGEGGPGIPETVHWLFRSAGSPDQSGVVTHVPEGTCILLGPRWNLLITTDEGGNAVPNAAARQEQFGHASPLDLAITRGDNGRVTITEGVPGWWVGKPIGCASN